MHIDHFTSSLTRRDFLYFAGLTSMLFPLSGFTSGDILHSGKRKIYIFSKTLHWQNYTAMADLVSECGLDGVDLTVRPNGHVEPERVEEDLPRAVEALKKQGKEVGMITTAIQYAHELHAEKILRTASKVGIPHYRTGWFPYETGKSIEENLHNFEQQLRELIVLDEKYAIKGAYQNHAGEDFGASVWDLGNVLHKINSPWFGCQYDIRHATVEGGTSWATDYQYIKPFIHSLDIKDFHWSVEAGKWTATTVPLGKGMVDFKKYFSLINSLPSSIPLCLHLEYPLGGAENGNKKITISAEEIKKAIKTDLQFIADRMQ